MDIADIKTLELNEELKRQIRFFREVSMINNEKYCRSLTVGLIYEEKYWKEIINEYIHKKLRDNGVINWWPSYCNGFMVINTKDKSLYASASIAMWGFKDTQSLYRDSKIEEKNFGPYGIKFLWNFERQRCLMYAPFHDPFLLECSYDFHGLFSKDSTDQRIYREIEIYILSNALMRPIIIFGFKLDESIQVYLPLNHNPDECCKNPLILAYTNKNNLDEYHPLLPMEDCPGENIFPLEYEKGGLAHVKFLINPDKDADLRALGKYMDVFFAQTATEENPRKLLCARMTKDRPLYYKAFKDCIMKWVSGHPFRK